MVSGMKFFAGQLREAALALKVSSRPLKRIGTPRSDGSTRTRAGTSGEV